MRTRKWLYNTAKQSNSDADWNAYGRMRNLISSYMISSRKQLYYGRVFDSSFSGNHWLLNLLASHLNLLQNESMFDCFYGYS